MKSDKVVKILRELQNDIKRDYAHYSVEEYALTIAIQCVLEVAQDKAYYKKYFENED